MTPTTLQDGQIVVILTGPHEHPVEEVNPRTRKTTGRMQQFKITINESVIDLEIVPRKKWVKNPLVLVAGAGVRLG